MTDLLITPLCILGGALLGAAWELVQRDHRAAPATRR